MEDHSFLSCSILDLHVFSATVCSVKALSLIISYVNLIVLALSDYNQICLRIFNIPQTSNGLPKSSIL